MQILGAQWVPVLPVTTQNWGLPLLPARANSLPLPALCPQAPNESLGTEEERQREDGVREGEQGKLQILRLSLALDPAPAHSSWRCAAPKGSKLLFCPKSHLGGPKSNTGLCWPSLMSHYTLG